MEIKELPQNSKFSLKQIREIRGLTQTEAAEKLQISKDTLGNYERGKSYPDIPILRRIEKLYGIGYNQLIFLPLDFGLTE